ncbi:MAG: DMT family transporter, partial [Gammaproteobacteria bacterium]|nr:DMT family transporter [Gammaproteobacteria bacterium]
THIAVQSIPPLTVAAMRLFIALLILYPVMRLAGQRLPAMGRLWFYIIGASFFGNAFPFALISWGQVRVDAGLTAILMAIMPLMTVLLAHWVTVDEKLNRYKFVGVLLGLLGVVVLMGWDKLGELGDQMLRQYAIAGAALCYSVNALLTKKLTQVARLPMMAALMLASSILLLPFSLVLERPWELPLAANSMTAVLILAVGPTAVATLMILMLVDRQGASFLSQINFMVPLFGVAFAWIFLGERLPVNAWAALVIILLGILLSRLGNRQTA